MLIRLTLFIAGSLLTVNGFAFTKSVVKNTTRCTSSGLFHTNKHPLSSKSAFDRIVSDDEDIIQQVFYSFQEFEKDGDTGFQAKSPFFVSEIRSYGRQGKWCEHISIKHLPYYLLYKKLKIYS